MNIPAIFSTICLALKTAVVVFLIIFALGVLTALVSAISTLLLALISLLKIATKATIYGYPLFLTGIISLKLSERLQKKETPTIALLPPSKKHIKKEEEIIQNDVLITPPSDEDFLIASFYELIEETQEVPDSPEQLRLEERTAKYVGEGIQALRLGNTFMKKTR